MNRRTFLERATCATVAWPLATSLGADNSSRSTAGTTAGSIDSALAKDWLARWERAVLAEARTRACDREMGEEIGWLVSPLLEGFHHAYRATGDPRWVERSMDWAESWFQRGVKEPDGYLGWPKQSVGGTSEESLLSDSLLGEAMGLLPVVLMAAEILKTPTLKEKHGAKAATHLELAKRTFEKWNARGCWREVSAGGLWVVPGFGLEPGTAKWTEGYARRNQDGFSNPANKQNHIARWLIALHDATGNAIYRERAEQWWRLMKTRLRLREDGRYVVWNYWDPAGPWDFKTNGAPRHWVGVHPNGGYYAIDVEGMVTAFEHGLVFSREDMDRLVRTNRDFMWNQALTRARFQRIDGGPADPRWQDSPGMLWTALVPQDPTLRAIFLANHDPASWGGLATTPWFLARENPRGEPPKLR